jgi:hypothetical protein
MNFHTISRQDVPQGRNGKHKQIISKILADLNQSEEGVALKIPMTELAEGKARVRAALSRATRKANRKVATATDANYLYVWNQK